MLENIIEKSATIALVGADTPSLVTLKNVLFEAQFNNIVQCHTESTLLNKLTTDNIDLVIVEGDTTLVEQILDHCTKSLNQHYTCVCAVVDETQYADLQKAYAAGLLAHLPKTTDTERLSQALNKLLTTLESMQADHAFTAALYLISLLSNLNQHDSLQKFTDVMITTFPNHTEQLLLLTKELVAVGAPDEAKRLANKLRLVMPQLTEELGTIVATPTPETMDASTTNPETKKELFNTFGVKNVVIIDMDVSVQNALKQIFEDFGCNEVYCFVNGEDAAKWIAENPNPSLIVQEWRLAQLNGPAFIQRILSNGAEDSTIIVLSSLVKMSDLSLLSELGVSRVVEKPLRVEDFNRELMLAIQQQKLPTELHSIESKLRRLLRNRRLDEAEPYFNALLTNNKTTLFQRLLFEGEWAYAKKDYNTAKLKCLEAFKQNDMIPLLAFDLLGRSLLQLGDFTGAAKCLEKATSISPQNIDRLCQISIAATELANEDLASESLEQAKDLDYNVTVKQTEAQLSLMNNDIAHAKVILESLSSFESLVGTINNRAVLLARTGQVDESLQEYARALEALPKNQSEWHSAILYNFALALVRSNKLNEALSKLNSVSVEVTRPNLLVKINSLKSRLKRAIANKEPLTLNEQPTSNQGQDKDLDQELSLKPGDYGCYLLYQADS